LGAQSRTIVLALISGILSFKILRIVNQLDNQRTRFIVLGLILSCLLLFVFPFVLFSGADIANFISGLGGKVAFANAQVRLDSYQIAIEFFKQSPILGIGPEVYKKYSFFINQMHNMWLGTALLGGIMGLIPLTIMISIVFFGALRFRHNVLVEFESNLIQAFTVSILVATLFYPAHNAYIFWVMLGVGISFWTLDD
jgi:O-antigen ligase